MKVEQLMAREVWTCTPDSSLTEASKIMWERDCGCVPVVDPDGSNRIVGMLTDRDICMAAYWQGKRLDELRASTAMSAQVKSCSPGDTIAQAEKIMQEARVRRLPALDGEGQLVGLLSLADIAREAARERASKKKKKIKDAEIGVTYSSVCEPYSAGSSRG